MSAPLTAPSSINVFQALNICPANPKHGTNYSNLCSLNLADSLPVIFTDAIIGAILLALIFLIWGGFKWIISGGDKGKVDSARSTIISSLVGLIIVFLSWFIMNMILEFFFGRGLEQGFALPQINLTQ